MDNQLPTWLSTCMKRMASKPAIQRGPNPGYDWFAVAAKLRKYPGVWFEVARFGVGTNQVWRIKTGANPAFREGQWDALSRTEDGAKVLYVCFLGEVE